MQQDIQALNSGVTADQVSDFLRSHPNFFEQQASLLADIFLPSPHGGAAISLVERQQLAQRDKIRTTEIMLAKLIEFGEKNDISSNKIHHFSLQLIQNSGLSNLQQMVAASMQQDFSVTQAVLRVWMKPDDELLAQNDIFTPVNLAFSDWVAGLIEPFCGEKSAFDDVLSASELLSFAYIPLFKTTDKSQPFGVLMLGSQDQQRFKTDDGKMYLQRIGELISAALANHI
jgi:uncharacterized protein YigA (DUF484 family)